MAGKLTTSLLKNLILLLAIGHVVVIERNRDSDWHGYMRYGKSCYLLSQAVVKWTEAYVYCQSFGSHLVYIESASEQRHIKSFLTFVQRISTIRTFKYWTGATDRVSNGHWMWSPAAKPVTFTNWAPGKPDNHKQDCIALYGNGQWDDDTCENERNFICEIELE